MQQTEDFLRSVWPTAGRKALFVLPDKTHLWFDNPHDAAQKALALDAKGKTVYHSMGGFAEESRTQEQCVALRAFFLDIDCGEGKPYAKKREGYEALQKLINNVNLPSPLVIDSGNGFHAYWPLTEDIEAARWLPMAQRLKSLCAENELQVDERVTADAARVLRPVGTHNNKNGKQVHQVSKQAYEYDDAKIFAALSGGFDFEAAQETLRTSGHRHISWNEPEPADFDSILEKCEALRWAFENQGAVGEPYWYDGLGIIAHCQDREHNALRFSKKHPGFTRDRTLAKLEHWRSKSGPTRCSTIRAHGHCNGCPHNITSPIVLGTPRNIVVSSVDPVTQFHVNPEVRVTSDGMQVRLSKKGSDDPPEWIKVNKYGLSPRFELRLPDATGNVSNYVWLEAYNSKNVITHSFIVPATGIANSMQFSTDCARQGCYFESETAPAAYRKFHKIMRTWVEQMKQKQGAIVNFRSFGWVGEDGPNAPKDSFLLGTTLYAPSGAHAAPVIPALAAYQKDMVQKGNLSAWVQAMDRYNTPGMEAQMFATWCIWGAPLMRFTSSGAAVFHIMGDTGVGKTSLQRSIISAYGDYNSKQLMDSSTSTLNSVNKSIGVLNSLPYCKEEVTETDAEELAQWALAITQGREKGRMTASGGLAQAATWSTIALTSANMSLREKIAAQRQDNRARLARIWEQEIELPVSQDEARQMFRPLQSNYGLAMPVYIQHVMGNEVSIAVRVQEAEDALTRQLRGTGADRFHISIMAANYVGVQIAVELGLSHHDIAVGMRCAFRNFHRLRRAAQAEVKTAEDTLARFIQEMQPATLVVEHDNPSAVVGIVFDSDNNVIRVPSATQAITMRYAKTTAKFYATVHIVRKWYADKHLNFETEMKQLEATGVLVNRQRRITLTKGTKYHDGKQTWCMEFDLSKAAVLVEAADKEEVK